MESGDEFRAKRILALEDKAKKRKKIKIISA
jgi:hypothetical protein